MKTSPAIALATSSAALLFTPALSLAQQAAPAPGSPSATITIPGNQLPRPDPAFGGVINQKASDSKPWWAPRVVPPKKAPNVLLIMTDDCGFGAPATFGGIVPTPALDRVAKSGIRYTNFHSTALCSPVKLKPLSVVFCILFNKRLPAGGWMYAVLRIQIGLFLCLVREFPT